MGIRTIGCHWRGLCGWSCLENDPADLFLVARSSKQSYDTLNNEKTKGFGHESKVQTTPKTSSL